MDLAMVLAVCGLSITLILVVAVRGSGGKGAFGLAIALPVLVSLVWADLFRLGLADWPFYLKEASWGPVLVSLPIVGIVQMWRLWRTGVPARRGPSVAWFFLVLVGMLVELYYWRAWWSTWTTGSPAENMLFDVVYGPRLARVGLFVHGGILSLGVAYAFALMRRRHHPGDAGALD